VIQEAEVKGRVCFLEVLLNWDVSFPYQLQYQRADHLIYFHYLLKAYLEGMKVALVLHQCPELRFPFFCVS